MQPLDLLYLYHYGLTLHFLYFLLWVLEGTSSLYFKFHPHIKERNTKIQMSIKFSGQSQLYLLTMQGLQNFVSDKLTNVLIQQQLSQDQISRIQSKIGKNLKESLQIIFSFYEDMNTLNESMIDQLLKQTKEAKLNEIVLRNSLSSLSRNIAEKGRSGQTSQQAQNIYQIARQKTEQISKAVKNQNELKDIQLYEKQKAQYEDQLDKNQVQIQQLKQDMRRLKSDHQKQVQQLRNQNKESKQLQIKTFISEFHATISEKTEQQKKSFSKLYQQERQKTLKSQQSISTLTKYISQLMKFDEIYSPEEGLEKWMSILNAKVEKYRRQIQISTGKKNSWEEKNPLKQLLNHHSNKLIIRNYRLAERRE